MVESFKDNNTRGKVIRRKKHQGSPDVTQKKPFYKKKHNKNKKSFKKVQATPTSLQELADHFNNHRHG
jgi:hypothetical protein